MAIDVKIPNIGDTEEVEVTEIMVRVGEKVEQDQAIITVESDKAAIEVPSPTSGIVKEIKIKIGDKVRTGSPMMVLDIEDTKIAAEKKEDKGPTCDTLVHNATTPITTDTSNDVVHATPLIRQMAREFGVNLTSVIGTGRKGRILREDIQSYIKDRMQCREETTLPPPDSTVVLPWPNKFGETEEVELSRVQKISSANLHRNWVMIPHVTQFDEADITDMEVFRKNHNNENEADKNNRDIKITPLSFIMKAVSKALEAYPRFNSELSEDGKKLILKKYVHIGVAVDTPKGLVVPVCYDVNKKGIIELSRNLKEMANKARSAKLAPADMQGGCFTISNLGSMGGTSFFTPIINAPEVAILGVSKSSMKLVWNGEAFVPRCILPLSLSYDHRVIDGADSARFIRFINTLLSDIRHLLM